MAHHARRPQTGRLKILGQEEIDALFGFPCFSDEDRDDYFALNLEETAALASLHSISSKMAFILLLGYFKARYLFVVFKKGAMEQDRVHVATRYFPDVRNPACTVSKGTRLKHQHLILTLCQYTLCTDVDRQDLFTKACEAARVSGKPIFIFRQLLREIDTRRITLPRYSFLQDTVSQAVQCEHTRLANILREQLTPSDMASLEAQLADTPGLYHLTQLKREPRDLSEKEIKIEIARGRQIRGLYQLAQRVLVPLQISRESIKYYSSLVTFYAVSRLKRLEAWSVSLYLLCFLHHRYQRYHDHLLISIRAYVRKTWELAKVAAQERVYDTRVLANKNVGKAAQVMQLFTTTEVAYATPFGEVQTRAFAILPREQIDQVANHITAQECFDETAYQWEHVEQLSLAFKRYVRPILLAIEIKGTPSQTPLIEAVTFLKTAFVKGRPLGSYPIHDVPLACLPQSFCRYIVRRESSEKPWRILPDRYEFGIYRLACERLDAGDIFCRDSVRFRSFEDDLIDEDTWHEQKDALLEQAGLAVLQQPIEDHLAALEEELESQLAAVNDRIAQGENRYITVKSTGDHSRWRLRYPRDEDETNHPIFDTLKQVDIGSVFTFVNGQTQFMDTFVHILGRYAKTVADERAITAALIAWGTNTGLSRMGQISDISYPPLSGTVREFYPLGNPSRGQ